MNAFTENDNRSIEKMLAAYEYESQALDYIDSETLDEKEQNIIASHSEGTQFLSEVRDSLDFTKASTLEVITNMNTLETESISLFANKEQYASCMAALTNDFDEKFINAVEATRQEKILPQVMTYNEYCASVDAPLENPAIASQLKLEENPERTVGDVVRAIAAVQIVKEQYGIDENTIPATLSAILEQDELGQANVISLAENTEMEYDCIGAVQVAALYQQGFRASTPQDREYIEKEFDITPNQLEGTLILLEMYDKYDISVEACDEAQKKFQEQGKPIEIVESIDGFVLNRSELTEENYKEISSKTEEGNEIAYGSAPAKETTIDPALAHGNIQLEEADDLGSIEEEKIEAGADLGALNEKHEEKSENKESTKKAKKDISMER